MTRKEIYLRKEIAMRIVKINIAEIHFERKEYPEILKESIMRIGLSFPIKIKN